MAGQQGRLVEGNREVVGDTVPVRGSRLGRVERAVVVEDVPADDGGGRGHGEIEAVVPRHRVAKGVSQVTLRERGAVSSGRQRGQIEDGGIGCGVVSHAGRTERPVVGCPAHDQVRCCETASHVFAEGQSDFSFGGRRGIGGGPHGRRVEPPQL